MIIIIFMKLYGPIDGKPDACGGVVALLHLVTCCGKSLVFYLEFIIDHSVPLGVEDEGSD